MKIPKLGWKRWGWIALTALVLLFLCTELFARFVLGLGDPPLMMTDPQIEYMFQPNQDIRRFHNRVAYNAFSMRSDPWAVQKAAGELRVLFIGDSVINGGSQTDQADIATSLLQNRLSSDMSRRVTVGNASAGGWGPVNEIAYARKFGFFNADIIVFVWSSHNYSNVHHEPPRIPSVDYPTTAPLLATEEGIMKYIPLLLAHARENDGAPAEYTHFSSLQSDIEVSTNDMRQLIDMAKATGAKVIVVQHLQKPEILHGLLPGHDIIAQIAKAADEDVDMGSAFQAALDSGQNPYRDFIHPNALGQRIFADKLEPVLLRYLQTDRSRPATSP